MKNYTLKISGAGNRFLLVDKSNFSVKALANSWKKHSLQINPSFEEFVNLAKEPLSYRKKFIKDLISLPDLSLADGLVVLQNREDNKLYCDFYNKDGSTAEMCGNAACCVSMYKHWQSLISNSFYFSETDRTILDKKNDESLTSDSFYFSETEIFCAKGGGIIFDLPDPSILDVNHSPSFSFINTGVPHGVIKCSKDWAFADKAKLKKLAKELRFKNIKGNKGMNVSFYQEIENHKLQAITYERGVEDWTLACGTGALATALVYLHKQTNKVDTILVNMPGGELKVQTKPNLTLFSPIKKGF